MTAHQNSEDPLKPALDKTNEFLLELSGIEFFQQVMLFYLMQRHF